MQIIVLNGTLSDWELDECVQRIAAVHPINITEKLYLNVHDDHIEVFCEPHKFRELRKMGGYCVGCPEDWNAAKQAELRDTLPNAVL